MQRDSGVRHPYSSTELLVGELLVRLDENDEIVRGVEALQRAHKRELDDTVAAAVAQLEESVGAATRAVQAEVQALRQQVEAELRARVRQLEAQNAELTAQNINCLLYTSPSPRD